MAFAFKQLLLFLIPLVCKQLLGGENNENENAEGAVLEAKARAGRKHDRRGIVKN